jgi:ubiquitin-protein ligase
MEILRLLREPNADDALSSVKGAQCKESRENYDNTIIEWKHLYANTSVEELKARYSLE